MYAKCISLPATMSLKFDELVSYMYLYASKLELILWYSNSA